MGADLVYMVWMCVSGRSCWVMGAGYLPRTETVAGFELTMAIARAN